MRYGSASKDATRVGHRPAHRQRQEITGADLTYGDELAWVEPLLVSPLAAGAKEVMPHHAVYAS